MSQINTSEFRQGLKAGIPIAVGYFPVAFTLGILGVGEGMTWWEATMISLFNLTSAGEFAGLTIIAAGGTLIEMALSQLVINLRYALMSITISQKVDDSFRGVWRFITPFSTTDEIFAVAAARKEPVSRAFWLGLSLLPIIGWTMGTLVGGLLGEILPARLLDALSIAIYAMFIAIVVPAAKQGKAVLFVVLIAICLSCLFYFVPALQAVPGGFTVIICAIVAAAVGALLFPVKDEEEQA